MEGRNNSPENKIEKPPKRILEIGAGVRSVVEMLKNGGKELGYSIISDLNEDRMKSAQLHGGAIEDVQRIVTAAYELPFKDSSFDYILAMNFFGNPGMIVGRDGEDNLPSFSPLHDIYPEKGREHLRLLFKELARVLSTGGEVCVIETYTPDIARKLFSEYKNTYEDFFIHSKKSKLFSDVGESLLDDVFSGSGEVYALKKK